MTSYLNSNYDLSESDVASCVDDLPLWSAPFGLKLLDVVEYSKNLNVLDVGSGSGFPLLELSQRLGPSSKSWGIDPWEAGVERIKKKIKTWGFKNVTMLNGQAENLLFENSFFDLIVSNNGTNNVKDEKKVFAEIARVAKTNAQLVVTVNLPGSMIEFYNVFEMILKKYKKIKEIDKMKQHIFSKRKPLEYTKELISNSGFRIQNSYTDYFTFRYTDGTAMLYHFVIKLAFMDSWKNILDPKDLKKIFSDIEIKLNKISEKGNGLALTVPWVCLDCRKE